MGETTEISWTDSTWNPLRGCTRVSEGCRNCYAEKMSARFSRPGEPYHGVAEMTPQGPRWTGKVQLVPEHLMDPLRWKKPRMIFVNSMSDTFHKEVPFDYIDKVFAVMAMCPQHTFQVLTKRPERMAEYMNVMELFTERYGHVMVRMSEMGFLSREDAANIAPADIPCELPKDPPWPLPNVWVGTSVEDQKAADERIPDLLQIPAAVRFLSVEPMLGPVDLSRYLFAAGSDGEPAPRNEPPLPCLRWVICGGESGPGARPMHPDWVRSLRDQCQEASVPFFFKQWGEWFPRDQWEDNPELVLPDDSTAYIDGPRTMVLNSPEGPFPMHRVGKKAAGRLLDGQLWAEMPQGSE